MKILRKYWKNVDYSNENPDKEILIKY